MNNRKIKVWPFIAGTMFAGVMFTTMGLIIEVVGLDMLPIKYLGLAGLAVAFLLFLIFGFFFLIPNAAKNIVKYVARTVGVLLAISLVLVDAVGIQMVNKFEETMQNVVENTKPKEDNTEEVVKVEEFIIGVYVLAEDKAKTLEDIKRYDFGYSFSYDRKNVEKAINLIENELDRSLKLEEYHDIFYMVDQLLAEEVDAFILSNSYLDIIMEQEGYEDILSEIKCIYECKVTSETQIVERDETEETFDITKDPFVVYISGHDVSFAAVRANSDVNILAAVNPETKQILLINTPRDYYVPISMSKVGEKDKLTHCGIYGVECSMDTLSEFYDVDINYYAQFNFTGFKRLIDAVGGISVYSEISFYSTNEGIYFEQGINHLNGEQALAFVRERKQFSGGDRMRGVHQMAVIKGVIEKMSSGSLLMNYAGVLDSMGGYFRCGFTQEEIAALVKMQLNDLAEWNIKSFSVTGSGDFNTSYSLPNLETYVMVPDEISVGHAKKLVDMVYSGKTIEDDDLTYLGN